MIDSVVMSKQVASVIQVVAQDTAHEMAVTILVPILSVCVIIMILQILILRRQNGKHDSVSGRRRDSAD